MTLNNFSAEIIALAKARSTMFELARFQGQTEAKDICKAAQGAELILEAIIADDREKVISSCKTILNRIEKIIAKKSTKEKQSYAELIKIVKRIHIKAKEI